MPARREDGRLGLLHDSVNNEASDVTLFFDASGNLLSFNHAAPGIFGYTHDEFYALGFSVIDPHFERDQSATAFIDNVARAAEEKGSKNEM